MHSVLKHLARVGVVVSLWTPWVAQAQAQCGLPGQPPCPVPEPASWPLAVLAVGIALAVRHIRRK